MASVSIYPMQDQFKTKLTQEYDWVSTWSIYVQETPSFTVPSGKTYCVVISPNTSIQQAVIISAHNSSAKTMNVSDASINKWPWLAYTQSTHPVWSEVIITDNFAHWEELVSVIDWKLDQTWWTVWSFNLWVTWSNWRIRKDWNDMKFRDDNQSEVTLSTIASSWSDEKLKVSVTDTSAWYLDGKLTAWDWITKTIVNSWGNESIDLDIDLSDTSVFSTTKWSSWKALRLDWSWNIDSSFSSSSSSAWLIKSSTTTTTWTLTATDEAVTPASLAVIRATPNLWIATLIASADTSWTITDATTYTTTHKTITCAVAWVYNFKFNLVGNWFSGRTLYGRIFVNWSPTWTEQVKSSIDTSVSIYSENITIPQWATIEFKTRKDLTWWATWTYSNLRMYSWVMWTIVTLDS